MPYDFPSNPVTDDVYAGYIWDGEKWKRQPSAAGGPSAEYVLKSGDVMTGLLTLSADPTVPLHAATKAYVDARALPTGGTVGQVLAINPATAPQWGAPADGGNY